jgi:hypothetical protein
MVSKKEIKKILKELNLTELDMDKYWNELTETNLVVKSVSDAGKTWRDMNVGVIKQIPMQKQKDLEEKERLEKENKEKEEFEKEYLDLPFDERMLNKIDNHENLSERELRELVFEYEDESYKEEGENRRWTQHVASYVQLKNRWFYIDWERGLTESQENEFYNQPVEVELLTYEKIIPEHKEIVTGWVEK